MRIILSLVMLFVCHDMLHARSEKRLSKPKNVWQLGPFIREDKANPIITPNANSLFFCPIQRKEIQWEGDHTFNPGAVVHEGKVYLLYRAEDNYGKGIGRHTSRIGLAESTDGIHFTRSAAPVLYPSADDQQAFEWPGGCEDPRIVQSEDGTFIMTYTQWTCFNDDKPEEKRNIPLLAIATSKDLRSWHKHGYAFAQSKLGPVHSKSGSIVCRLVEERLVPVKIQDKYWMYWGDGPISAATSTDLIHWEPILDSQGGPLAVLDKRPGTFDSELVEAGPPALLTHQGIVLLYNGKNSKEKGDPHLSAGAYSAGQVLFDSSNPLQVRMREGSSFFKPERAFEKTGQYESGTVFIEGLVRFKGQWFLYYGAADSAIGVAVERKHKLKNGKDTAFQEIKAANKSKGKRR